MRHERTKRRYFVSSCLRANDMAYTFLVTRRDGPVEYLTLNRPDVRNAFNEEMIAELTGWAADITDRARNGEVRAAGLSGAGQSFCAGGDLAWMATMARYSDEENL